MILRELFVKLGLNVDEQSFAKGELAAEVVKASLEKVVDVAKELIDTFVENIKATAEYGEKIEGLAQSVGLSTTELQQLGKAAALEGMSIDDFGHSMVLLSRTMVAAKDGSEEAQAAFSKTGVKIKDASGHVRSAGDVFEDLADHFSSIPDGAEKTALALKLFGRSGADMIQVLNNGREEIAKFRQASVMTPEQVKASKDMVILQRQIAAQTKVLWRSAVAPLLPAISGLLKRYLEWKKANTEVMKQQIQKYIGFVIKAVNKLGDAFSFLVRNATAIKAIVITALVAGFAQLETAAVVAAAKTAVAWLAAAAPFIALAALIAGILLVFDDIRVYQKGGKSLYGRFKNEIEQWLKPQEKDPWFVTAIKDFVRLLHDAIELIDEFYKATGRVNPREVDRKAGISSKAIQQRSDVMTQATARNRVAMGLPLTDEEKASLKRAGVSEEAFLQKYGSKGPLPAPTPEQFVAQQQGPVIYRPEANTPMVLRQSGPPVNVQVYAAPGMSEEQVGRIAADKIAEHWDNQMEAAAASVGP